MIVEVGHDPQRTNNYGCYNDERKNKNHQVPAWLWSTCYMKEEDRLNAQLNYGQYDNCANQHPSVEKCIHYQLIGNQCTDD